MEFQHRIGPKLPVTSVGIRLMEQLLRHALPD